MTAIAALLTGAAPAETAIPGVPMPAEASPPSGFAALLAAARPDSGAQAQSVAEAMPAPAATAPPLTAAALWQLIDGDAAAATPAKAAAAGPEVRPVPQPSPLEAPAETPVDSPPEQREDPPAEPSPQAPPLVALPVPAPATSPDTTLVQTSSAEPAAPGAAELRGGLPRPMARAPKATEPPQAVAAAPGPLREYVVSAAPRAREGRAEAAATVPVATAASHSPAVRAANMGEPPAATAPAPGIAIAVAATEAAAAPTPAAYREAAVVPSPGHPASTTASTAVPAAASALSPAPAVTAPPRPRATPAGLLREREPVVGGPTSAAPAPTGLAAPLSANMAAAGPAGASAAGSAAPVSPTAQPAAVPDAPPALSSDRFGEVHIGLEGDARELKVSLAVSSGAPALLAAEAPRLAADLAANGIRLQTLDVGSFAGGTASGGQQPRPGQPHASAAVAASGHADTPASRPAAADRYA